MKTRVVARAFYEDAYLDFFISYYLAIGFDEVVLLKADCSDKYELEPYVLPDYFTEEWKSRVKIIPVENTGNKIIQEHYNYFKDETVDWVLNIDCDEFLVLDWNKYTGGINDYLEQYLEECVNMGLVNDKEHIQQIKYRWMCITKMDNKWDKQDNTMLGYLDEYNMEVYKYIKSFGAIKDLIDDNARTLAEGKINCHFYLTKNISNKLNESYKVKNNKNILNKNNIYLLDNLLCKINNSDPRTFRKDGKACVSGFILHINTRSLANALTKCLTTNLRKNKKISNLSSFQEWVNNLNLDELNKYKTDLEKYSQDIHNIKKCFNSYLNSKSFFPRKISKYNSIVNKYLDMEVLKDLVINRCINTELLKEKISGLSFVNLDKEKEILNSLCVKNNVSYDKIWAVMSLY